MSEIKVGWVGRERERERERKREREGERLTHISCRVHKVIVLPATFPNQPWEGPVSEK